MSSAASAGQAGSLPSTKGTKAGGHKSRRDSHQDPTQPASRPSSGSSSASATASTSGPNHGLRKSRPLSLTGSVRSQAATETSEYRPSSSTSRDSEAASLASPTMPESPRLRRKRASRDLSYEFHPPANNEAEAAEQPALEPVEETWSRRRSLQQAVRPFYGLAAPTPPPAESGQRCDHTEEGAVQSGK